jgi:hypothetical protein
MGKVHQGTSISHPICVVEKILKVLWMVGHMEDSMKNFLEVGLQIGINKSSFSHYFQTIPHMFDVTSCFNFVDVVSSCF